MRTAAQVVETLGHMKGALMKLGQMASYLDDGMPEPMQAALASLQQDAPPMAPELCAQVVREELGADPTRVFAAWDPDADRGGVDRSGPSRPNARRPSTSR